MGIPRLLRDFQAGWESRLFDFSIPRLFHSPSALHFVVCQGRTLGAVSAQPVRSMGEAERSIQMLVESRGAARQVGAPAHRFDLQTEILNTNRVVAIHRPFELQRQDQIQIAAAARHERVARWRRRYLKTTVELGDIAPSQKCILCFQE